MSDIAIPYFRYLYKTAILNELFIMKFRIQISPKSELYDIKSKILKNKILESLGINVLKIKSRDVYVISADLTNNDIYKVASEFVNPVTEEFYIGFSYEESFEWMISIGFKPGVTDNLGKTAITAISDILRSKFDKEQISVMSSTEYFLSFESEITKSKVEMIVDSILANRLINSVDVKSFSETLTITESDANCKVKESLDTTLKIINLNVSDEKLIAISKNGTLALSLDEMKVIQNYFKTMGERDLFGLVSSPTDVEIECIAQSWSEHCKHKIFDAKIEYENENGDIENIDSCFKSYIKKSTEEISQEVDWLVSVFHDNAGVISFNNELDLVYKAETHNSPSALDPYGGAMTGIVGVNRDPLGTGLGAELLINTWGYCLGSPFTPLEDVPQGLLHPKRIRDGVHKGVIDGGNQSGIPYGLGWEYFDERYIGKPLVFCGTVGLLPKKIGKLNGSEKQILSGDLIVMTGGRIGKDGIHGATFSSEELHSASPVQAVQIGDPITQKMMADFIYEARDLQLYRFITDNGAGGLSSSIGEMAKESDGCFMDLGKAPLKYQGLAPWEILISEAQERMSFAVPKDKVNEFLALAARREVEASVLGEFTNSGKLHLLYNGKTVAYLDLNFIHDGCPKMQLKAKWEQKKWEEPSLEILERRKISSDVCLMLERLNITSNEFKSRQYDHEVKGLSVVKPFVGVNHDIASDAAVFMNKPLSYEGIVLTSALLPRYSDIDTYDMMGAVIDLALRKAVAAGVDFGHVAGLDNFCWPDPVQSEKTPDGEYKLAQLVRANMALYDYTKAFKVPCISGKDSMKNDSTKGGKKISIPPTVLFSTIGKISNVTKAQTFDFKKANEYIYVIGETDNELGGSEYFAMLGFIGNKIPKTNAIKFNKLYGKVSSIVKKELVSAIIATGIGGIAIALAKMSMAGNIGLKIDSSKIPAKSNFNLSELLFSESGGRFVVSVSPERVNEFQNSLEGFTFAKIGFTTGEKSMIIDENIIKLAELKSSYKELLNGI